MMIFFERFFQIYLKKNFSQNSHKSRRNVIFFKFLVEFFYFYFRPQEFPSSTGRGAQLLANMNSMNVGDSSQRRDRGPQAKIFGIPQGTSEVVEFLYLFAGQIEFIFQISVIN